MFIGRGHARKVGGVHHEHGVELEADVRPRLHVVHARQQERGQHLLVAHAGMNPGGDLFEQPLTAIRN